MARKPFFSGNYGSALGSTANAANLIARAGATQGQMFANLGGQIGGMIQQYGLNKEKRAVLTGEIEAMLPQYMDSFTNTGDEIEDKKNFNRLEKFSKGDMSMADLKGLAGELAMKDKVQARAGENEARAIANEFNRLGLGVAKELQNTKIQLGKDQGTISRINAKVAEMRARGFTKEEENMLKKLDLLGRQIDSDIELVKPKTNAEKARLKAVPRQVEQQEELGDLQVKAAERADTSADLLLQAFGGAEGKAEFDYQGAKLSRKNVKLGMKVLSQKGDYYDYLATAKGVPVDTKKQYASIVSDIGKLTDTLVKDPDTGNQIPFSKYMELANGEPEMYPLTGANSGPAGRLYGSFLAAQKQADDLLKTTQVQVDDGQDTGGSPAPTGSTMKLGNQSPEQAMQMLQERIGQIRRELPKLNAQEQQLGQPGQMTTTAFDTSPMGNINTPLAQRPQTIGDVQNSNIPQQRADLMAELQQLEAKRQELQNQFGVR